MPRSFSDSERTLIHQRLLDAGESCWGRYGIRRTNVEDLARMAGISKGTFYLFFETKELFFMAVLERMEQRIKERMLQSMQTSARNAEQRFVEVILSLYNEVKQFPWLVSLMGRSGDYEYLVRKLPEERIKQHIMADEQDTAHLLQILGLDDQVNAVTVSAALRGLFCLLLHQDEIGTDRVDSAFRLLLEGLGRRLFEGVAK